MFDIYIRNVKDLFYLKLLSPFFFYLKKYHVSPNHITITGFLMGLVACYNCYMGCFEYALGFWVLNRFIDGLDGKIKFFNNLYV